MKLIEKATFTYAKLQIEYGRKTQAACTYLVHVNVTSSIKYA